MQSERLLLNLLLAILLLPLSASALLMRENGPEPIIVQIKESLRLSDELDARLNEFAGLRRQSRLEVVKWWAGSKLLTMLSFPANFTEQQAMNVVRRLQESPAVEKVVAASAYNLEFKSGDFAREYGPADPIPDVARRGFDRERLGRPQYRPPDQLALLHAPHVPDRLIVRWKDEYIWRAERTGFLQRIAAFNRDARCRLLREERRSPTELVQILESEDISLLADKLKRYMDSGLIVYAQPDYLYRPFAVPNDPAYSSAPGAQWNLRNINAEAAWNITTGDPQVIVAVADTGANLGHPDFSTNLWNGQHYDFYYGRPDVSDTIGHGSNVAAIIGAQGDNAFAFGSNGGYMTGVAWDVSMMILKVFNDDPERPNTSSSAIDEAVDYARARGVTAMNMSLGRRIPTTDCIFDEQTGRPIYCEPPSYGPDQFYYDALKRARESNMVVVTSAGNERGTGRTWQGVDFGESDDPYVLVVPASIPTDNNIAVLATKTDDTRAAYSNSGAQRVDLGAPGGSAVSQSAAVIGLKQTFNANSFDWNANYSFYEGTSMAAPHVTGALALIKSRFSWENYAGIRDRVLMGTARTGTLEGMCRTNGRVDLYKALQTRSMVRNFSTRARVEGGDRAMIGGFVIGGSVQNPNEPPLKLKVGIRGRGPSLPVSDVLGNPRIKLYNSGNIPIAQNNNWRDSQEAAIRNSGLAMDGYDTEAALIIELDPGSYTVVLEDEGADYGVGLFEIYELEGNADEKCRLRNLSTRCLVGVGENEVIAGTIFGDFNNPHLPKPDRRFLIFGKGPSLPVSGALQDPQIQILQTGESNEAWYGIGEWLAEELYEAGIAPTNGNESALWPMFQAPGSFTVALRGTNGGAGIGLIEFFEY